MTGGLPQLMAQRAHAGFGGGEHVQGGGDLKLPGRRQVRGRGRPQPGQARLGAQGVLAEWWGALVEEHRVDALHPGGVRTVQVVVGLQQRPVLQDVYRRDPALREPALGQQRPEMPGVGLSVLACRLRPRSVAVSAGSARCTAIPAAASSPATYRHPVHPSTANATSSRPANRASQARRCSRPG